MLYVMYIKNCYFYYSTKHLNDLDRTTDTEIKNKDIFKFLRLGHICVLLYIQQTIHPVNIPGDLILFALYSLFYSIFC